MSIDLKVLQNAMETVVKPLWENPTTDWDMRKGGGETYIQEKVLKKAQPYLSEERLQEHPQESVLNALKAHDNLLSSYDFMQAIEFVKQVPETELRDHMVSLLYGPEDLRVRVRRFLEWAKVQPIPETKKKKGIKDVVCSYLLCISNPREYAFCKPSAYNPAVTELLGKSAVQSNSVERILHCGELYLEVLQFLKENYGLEDGNLLDVHSIFYFLQSKENVDQTGWETARGVDPPSDPGLYDLLVERHNVVLYGPPGTGKTREAIHLAAWWRRRFGDDSVAQVTFHPSYCYEDFIEGYRPDANGEGFTLKPGIFKNLCKNAMGDAGRKYLLVIDEINRGDLARILGELITLIEGDKRGEDCCTILQQSGDKFHVPANIYILGTMNTADKSISLMDLAIRRRFLFRSCQPDPDILDTGKVFWNVIEDVRLSQLLIGLNERLVAAGVDRDRALGQSFLLIHKEKTKPLDVLRRRFRYEIIPLVEEYCYTDRSQMGAILGDLMDATGSVNTDVLEDDERFVAALRGLCANGTA